MKSTQQQDTKKKNAKVQDVKELTRLYLKQQQHAKLSDTLAHKHKSHHGPLTNMRKPHVKHG